MSSDLDEAKRRLLEKLGPSYSAYIHLLGKWFRGIISKNEFDRGAKQLVEQNFVSEHNKFWLAFFHHCANNASKNINFHISEAINKNPSRARGFDETNVCCENHPDSPDSASTSCRQTTGCNNVSCSTHLCLPNNVITNMRIYVIAWEMGIDRVDDQVTEYINIALQHFLKNIISEVICSKTAYRLRENRFKYAYGVKPMNPYLSNSLKIYSTNLEYDPYQIESNKMNSSLVDTYAYNDSLFPARLYEAQALYEYACSTTSVATDSYRLMKKPRISKRRLNLNHLLIAFLGDRTIVPSQSMYHINLERIFTKLA